MKNSSLRSSGIADIALWHELLEMLEVVRVVVSSASVLTTLAIDIETHR